MGRKRAQGTKEYYVAESAFDSQPGQRSRNVLELHCKLQADIGASCLGAGRQSLVGPAERTRSTVGLVLTTRIDT